MTYESSRAIRVRPLCFDLREFGPAAEVFQLVNSAVSRLTISEKPEDYEASMRVLDEISQIVPLSIFAMVAMPNQRQKAARHSSEITMVPFAIPSSW